MIPKAKCIHHRLYVVSARNISGVAVCVVAENRHTYFVGIREKFGSEYPASEHHTEEPRPGEKGDTCVPGCGWGYVVPLAKLPDTLPKGLTSTVHQNDPLLAWLYAMRAKYS